MWLLAAARVPLSKHTWLPRLVPPPVSMTVKPAGIAKQTLVWVALPLPVFWMARVTTSVLPMVTLVRDEVIATRSRGVPVVGALAGALFAAPPSPPPSPPPAAAVAAGVTAVEAVEAADVAVAFVAVAVKV